MSHIRAPLVLLFALLLLAPAAAAPPPDNKGLERACERATAEKPCEHLRIIPDTVVTTGTTRTYANGTYQGEGTIEVQTGGAVVVDNATIRFHEGSGGFLVHAGGTLVVKQSRLEEAADGSSYVVDARPGSTLRLTGSEVDGGEGILLATEDAQVHTNVISNIPVALRNQGVSVRIHHNAFHNNTVSVNNTGGFPTLDNNTFQGGAVCVRDWLSDPTIVYNTFRGCHTGIYHHRSESKLSFNDMENSAHPPGGGIVVEDTMSPTIEGNIIRNYGTGILIKNARAYIRNNTIQSNVLDGIHIDTNSAPMDIRGNDVSFNGRHGITLLNATNLPVFENDVQGNAEAGIFVNVAGSDIVVDTNRLSGNKHGIVVANANGTTVQRNWINDTVSTAISIDAASVDVSLSRNHVRGAAYGIYSHGERADLYYNAITDAAVGIRIHGDGTTLFGDAASGGGDGLVIYDAGDVHVEIASFQGNAGNGVAVVTGRSPTFVNVNASDNGAVGFYISGDIIGQAALYGPRALGNAYGVLNAGGNSTFAVQGWFEGNAHAGFRNDDPSVHIFAENAYWGSSTGPTHVDNPGGTGDAVIGNVDYDPFLTAPPAMWSPPTFVS